MSHYSAKRLPTHVGKAPWLELLEEPPPAYPELDHSKTVDITIIGAGFAGLAAAQRLLQIDNTLQIAIVDAGKIGEGASGRNSGFMIDLPHDLSSDNYSGDALSADQKLISLNRQAIAFANDAVDQYNINRDYFQPIGKVNGAASVAANQCNSDYSNHLSNLNEPFERLDAQSMYELTGSRHYYSGVYTPGTVLIQPAGLCTSLAAGLSQLVHIYENTPALGINRIGNTWTVESNKGCVTSHKVILANNGHLESFGFAKNRLMHVFLYASMTHELNQEQAKHLGGQANWGITPSDPMGTTIRRFATTSGSSRIITRTCAHYLPSMHTSEKRMKHAADVHLQKFNQRFNSLAGLPMQYQWAGHLCLTRNGVSVAQELDTNLFSACAQNGLGATRGILTGIRAAEHSLGVKTEIGAFFEREKPASLLPPAALSKPIANALLKWKERRAADE